MMAIAITYMMAFAGLRATVRVTSPGMKPRKTTVRLLVPLRKRFNALLDQSCLKRDAYLNEVLDVEVQRLDDEIRVPNSQRAREHIAAMLKQTGSMELVTLTLRSDLLDAIDSVCERKLICRDAFFNRLLYLLTASDEVIDQAFFWGDRRWRTDVWTECQHDGPFFRNVFSPLDQSIDPFWTIRAGIELISRERPKSGRLTPDGIYTRSLPPPGKGEDAGELKGLACYLHDASVPRTQANKKLQRMFEKYLDNSTTVRRKS